MPLFEFQCWFANCVLHKVFKCMSVKCFYIQSIISLYPKINNFKEMSCWNLFFKIYISSLSHTHTHIHDYNMRNKLSQILLLILACYQANLEGWLTLGQPLGMRPLGWGSFFSLVIDDIVVFIWINGSFCTSLSGGLAQTSRLIKHAYFRCWGSEFQSPWLVE